MAYVDNTKISGLIKQVYNINPRTNFVLNEKKQYQVTIDYKVVGNRYATIFITVNPEESKVDLGSAVIDLDTGKVVSQEDMDNWKNQNGIK